MTPDVRLPCMRFLAPHPLAIVTMMIVVFATVGEVSAQNSGEQPPSPAVQPQPDLPALDDASPAERATLNRMLNSNSWPRRAIVTLRMERYGCDESKEILIRLLHDSAWQVRAYAIHSLARRSTPAAEDWFSSEQDPRIIRTLLRCRYSFDPRRLERGVRYLTRSSNLEEKMLGVEIGAASDMKTLQKLARDAAKKIILRMNRAEAGALSPRLALVTGQRDLRRPYLWRNWLLKAGRSFTVGPAYLIPENDQALAPRFSPPLAPPLLAKLESDRFAALEDYMVKLNERQIDLAVCLDCTASMAGEIAEAQGGLDDMMLFLGDIVGSLRLGIVGYRDRRDEFETKGWDFTTNVDEARSRLWQLIAEGGGDRAEAVHPALKFAYQKFTWIPENTKVLVLVGDAPPHVGLGASCIKLAAIARKKADLTTHVIQAGGRDVKHFPEIAEAGGGHCVTLEDDDSLIAEITGLTLGDAFEEEFREFFKVYLALCR